MIDIVYQVGGTLQFLLIFSMYLAMAYSEPKKNVDTLNKLFNFSLEKKIRNRKNSLNCSLIKEDIQKLKSLQPFSFEEMNEKSNKIPRKFTWIDNDEINYEKKKSTIIHQMNQEEKKQEILEKKDKFVEKKKESKLYELSKSKNWGEDSHDTNIVYHENSIINDSNISEMMKQGKSNQSNESILHEKIKSERHESAFKHDSKVIQIQENNNDENIDISNEVDSYIKIKKESEATISSNWLSLMINYLISFLCPKFKNKNIILYKKGIRILSNSINYLSYIKLIYDVEKIKKLLLTKEQRSIFNFITKPTINLETNVKKMQTFFDDQDMKGQLYNIFAYFKNISQKKEKMTKVDKKLFTFLDSSLQKLIVELFELKDLL